jgi:site-specific recombinase XerD
MSAKLESAFPTLLQDFFCQRLINQQNASPRTVASYRDSFRLLLRFAQQRMRKTPADFTLIDIDAPLVLAFLNHIEKERSNVITSRNVRLAAIRSFMKYVALREPAALATVQRVLAIPFKRFDRAVVEHLSRDEIDALLNAPDRATWSGRRDRVMLETFYNTGARVSEIVALDVGDLSVGTSASLRIRGKGRKERTVPLWKRTSAHLREWLRSLSSSRPTDPLFPGRIGRRLTRSGVEARLRDAVAATSKTCPSIGRRRVSPHVLRHTTAMHLLQSGVDITVIALWLGHESPTTTHRYMEADLAMKERALAKLSGPTVTGARFRPSDRLIAFLETL